MDFLWTARAAKGREVTKLKVGALFKMSATQLWREQKKKNFKIRFAKRFEQDGECLCRRGVLSAVNTHRNSGLGLSIQFLRSTGSRA